MKASYWVLKKATQKFKRYSQMFIIPIKEIWFYNIALQFLLCKIHNKRTDESKKTFHLSTFLPTSIKHTTLLFLTGQRFLLKNRNTACLSINCQNTSFFTAHVNFWGCSPAVGSRMHWRLNIISRLQHRNKQVQSTIDKYLYKQLHKV